MARGKHKAAKFHRAITEAREAIDDARRRLAAEQEALAGATKAKAATDELKRQLSEAGAARDRACEPECARLAAEHSVLEQFPSQVRKVDQVVGDRWDKLSERVITALGGGVEGFERLLAITSGTQHAVTSGVVRGKKLDSDQAVAVQRARGDRRADPTDYAGYQIDHSMETLNAILPHLADTTGEVSTDSENDEDSDTDENDDTGRALNTSIYGAQPHHISSWNPMPWLSEESLENPRGDVAKTLGIVSNAAQPHRIAAQGELSAQPLATLSAATRRAISTRPTPEVIMEWRGALEASTATVSGPAARIPSSIGAQPRHPIPVDAAALKHWYANSALGLACRGWKTGPVAEMAIAATAAVPYWLPPGHTISYVDSEPLSAADVADIRMPYPQVFLGLADPLRLNPSSDADADSAAAIEWIEHAVVDTLARKLKYDIFDAIAAATQGFQRGRVPVFDAIAHRGAVVEGVVLLSDASGRLDDLFGWCIAIPAAGGGLLGRWTLPASLSRTAYRDQVTNLAAVTSWAQWHHAEDEEHQEPVAGTRSGLRPAPRPADAVRVLNVKATGSESTSGGGDQRGHTMAPHIRRGHWRRQHYGPGRSQVKRIRIAPVLVNAGMGDIGLRVYRLPAVGVASA